jgi:8-oxo-dGTP pyrophosphatase MutT (NUDIX family)
VDGADLLLLMKYTSRQGSYWLTPGGGVDQGETVAVAASRELREEVGLAVGPEVLGQPVAFASGWAEFSWAKGLFRDDFFFHRIISHEVDKSGFTELERTMHDGHKWWSRDELATTEETVYPLELVLLLDRLLAGSPPTEPVQLPWHH